MAWTYNGLLVKEGRSWKDNNGTTHPPQWSRWDDDYKIKMGLVFVAEQPRVSYDRRFYQSNGSERDLMTIKEEVISSAKNTASSLLSPTDWYVIRKSETGDSLPKDISDYRTAVRKASNDIEFAVNACETHAEIVAIHNDDTLNVWPEKL